MPIFSKLQFVFLFLALVVKCESVLCFFWRFWVG